MRQMLILNFWEWWMNDRISEKKEWPREISDIAILKSSWCCHVVALDQGFGSLEGNCWLMTQTWEVMGKEEIINSPQPIQFGSWMQKLWRENISKSTSRKQIFPPLLIVVFSENRDYVKFMNKLTLHHPLWLSASPSHLSQTESKHKRNHLMAGIEEI